MRKSSVRQKERFFVSYYEVGVVEDDVQTEEGLTKTSIRRQYQNTSVENS